MTPIHTDVPGRIPMTIEQLVLDFTGTLSKDGVLLEGVGERLTALSKHLRIRVMTADTFGKARQALAGLPVDIAIIKTGQDKADYVAKNHPQRIAIIGNGHNDVPMSKVAGLAVAVIGPEGAAGELLQSVDVVATDICDALDLLANPLRLKATLRD